MTPRFRSVVLDVDSTLCALEGIDWLAQQRDPEVAARVSAVTDRAMNGEIPLQSVYGTRLALVRPDAALLRQLAGAYVGALLPGAAETVHRLQTAGIEIAVVSGGVRQALLPLVEHLGIPPGRLRAVDVRLDVDGNYEAFDADSPLTGDTGKLTAVRELALPRPVLAVGDGNTDLAMRAGVDAFAAFVGVVRREPVVARADYIIQSFAHLERLVLT